MKDSLTFFEEVKAGKIAYEDFLEWVMKAQDMSYIDGYNDGVMDAREEIEREGL